MSRPFPRYSLGGSPHISATMLSGAPYSSRQHCFASIPRWARGMENKWRAREESPTSPSALRAQKGAHISRPSPSAGSLFVARPPPNNPFPCLLYKKSGKANFAFPPFPPKTYSLCARLTHVRSLGKVKSVFPSILRSRRRSAGVFPDKNITKYSRGKNRS